MSIEAWLAFVAATAILVVIPGPTILTVILPQFINRHADVNHQLWMLAVTFVVIATINASLYAVFASSAASFLASRRAKQGFDIVGGSLLSIAGAWALLAKRATS